jgi:hypothetical protein
MTSFANSAATDIEPVTTPEELVLAAEANRAARWPFC